MTTTTDSAPAVGETATDPRGDALLVLAAAGNARRLAEMRRRHAAGEPAPYIVGFLLFRSRRFAIDRRAYITDPEATHLVDAVAAEGVRLAAHRDRPLQLLEFGVGAGTLALSVKLEHPEWALTGIDIDPPALALARANAAAHHAALALLEGDYLAGWPASAAPPDILFGDPPWGGPADLYDDTRDARYYEQMPPRSAFPGGESPCGIHDEIIRRLCALAWPTTLILNYGVLPADVIRRSAAPLASWRLVHPQPRLSILVGRATG